MNGTPSGDAPKSFTIAAAIIALWMTIGVLALGADLATTPEQAAQLTEAQRQLRDARPVWLMVVYGVATLGGLVGALGLLMKRAWCIPMLLISFIAVMIQFGYITFGMDSIALLGVAAATAFPAFIVAMGGVSLWYATRAKANGWLS
jgi:hypothetical protein